MGFELGSAHGKIVIDSSGVTTGIATALNGLQRLESQVTTLGRNVSRVGDQLIQNLTLPIVGVGVASGKMAMDFESSMQQIVGLVGVSQKQVNAWSQQLLDLGPKVGKGPKELADALYFITSAGIQSSDAIGVLEQSAKAASAGLGETKIVAQAVSAAMNAYRTSGLTAAQATDILVAAVREGTGEASDFAPVLGHVIPIAAEIGISFNQVAAAMAAMTLQGVPAAEAATNLSGIMAALIKPSKQASDILAEFGLSAEQLRDIASTGPDGLLNALTLLKETIGQDDEAFSKVFGNIRGYRGVLELVGTNAARASEIFGRLANTTGDAGKAFDAAAQTMKVKFDSALASVQGGLIKFGNAVLPVAVSILQDLANTLRDVTTWFSKLDSSTQETIVKILALVAALGPVLSIGGRLLTTIGSLMGVFNGLAKFVFDAVVNFGKLVTTGGEVIGFLAEAGVYGLAAVGAIAALAASIVILIKFLDAASRAAHATNEELIAMANSNTGNVIEDSFNSAGAAAELLLNGSNRLKAAFVAHQEEMQDKLRKGEITQDAYNTEIERSAKVAGLWRDRMLQNGMVIEDIDGSVRILTEAEVKLLSVTHDYADIEAIRAQRVATSASATDGLTSSVEAETAAALAAQQAQEALNADLEAGGAMLDQLRALIDGQVGPAYDDFIGKNDELVSKQRELRDELAKLEDAQGKQVTTQKRSALTSNELRLAQEQLAAAQSKLTKETDPLKQAKLAVEVDKLTAKIGGASAATTAWVDNSKRIGEIEGELGELDTALKANADAYDERLKRILFDMAAEQLAADGMTTAEAGALNALALKFGLIDQATADMTNDVLRATDQLAKDQNVENFVNNLETDFDRAKTRAAGVPDDLAAVGEAYNRMAQDASTRGGEVVTATTTMADQIGDPIARAQESFGKLATEVATTAGTVKTQTAGMQTATTTALSGMDSTIKQYGPGIGAPLLTGAQTMSSGVIDALNDILDKVADVIEALLGIHIPNIQLPGGGGGGSGGGGGGGTCFTGDTLITLADGTQCRIDQVRRGDTVLTFEPGTAEFSAGLVTETLAHAADGYLHVRTIGGLSIRVTGEHPFYLPRRRADAPTIHGEFVCARDLRAGDQLVSPTDSGTETEIIEQVMALTESGIMVYNLNVEPCHTYVAGGVIVHNIKIDSAFVVPKTLLPDFAGRQALTPPTAAAVASQTGTGQGRTITHINNFYDSLATKMYLEQERQASLRSIADQM